MKNQEVVEINAGIYASPTAILSFVICDYYGFGGAEAGFDAVVGIISGMLVIPLI